MPSICTALTVSTPVTLADVQRQLLDTRRPPTAVYKALPLTLQPIVVQDLEKLHVWSEPLKPALMRVGRHR
jgi:hypothetical protein